MRFLIAIVLCLCASPALATQAQPGEAKPCVCGVSCGCAPLACRCPKLVTFQDGTKAVFVPGPVDTKGGWPFQGPFRWMGAAGRWSVGAPPRFVR